MAEFNRPVGIVLSARAGSVRVTEVHENSIQIVLGDNNLNLVFHDPDDLYALGIVAHDAADELRYHLDQQQREES